MNSHPSPSRSTRHIIHLAVASLLALAGASASTVSFDPTQPLTVSNSGGFTGTFSPQNPYTQAAVRFTFSGLTDPLPSSFQITNIYDNRERNH